MMENVEDLRSDWIQASDALFKLTIGGKDPVAVKAMLADYLRDGRLKARAEAVWVSTEPTLHKAWKSQEATDIVELDIEVPLRYWRSDKRPTSDRARWRWPYDKFFHTIGTSPLRRRMMQGVSFRTSDLAKLQPDSFREENKPRRGRKHDVTARDAGWMEVVRLSQEDCLNSELFPTGASLAAELGYRLGQETGSPKLGENQIRDIAAKVVRVLKPRPTRNFS